MTGSVPAHAARTNGVHTVKAHNYRALLLNLLRHQPISRVRLAQLCRLSTTTVTNLVTDLVAQGVVEEMGPDLVAARPGAGRPPLALQLVPESRFVLGVHIGVRQARLGVYGIDGRRLAGELLPLVPQAAAEQTLSTIVAVARRVLSETGLADDPGRLLGVGLGASGLVDSETGVNVLAPNLGWRDVPVRARLEDLLQLPVTVDNNVRCMALAESLFGAGRNVRALAYVYVRVGVGAGLVVDGQIYRGARYGAGEIGHWTMVPKGGASCRCGNSGCLETLIAEPVLIERARQVDLFVVEQNAAAPLQAVLAAARRGHAGMRALLAEQAFYLGIALANLVNVLNPEMIMLGGLLQEAYDLLHGDVVATVHRHAFGGLGRKVSICPASFGDEAGEIGAAALAVDSFFLSTPRRAAAAAPVQPVPDGATTGRP